MSAGSSGLGEVGAAGRTGVPVGHSLQSSAVAAGQPEGAVGQQVGAVWNLQYQQVTSCGL